MQRNDRFRDDDWRRPGWRDGPDRRCDADPVEHLADLAAQAGLWASGCLAVASLAPAVLVAPLLRELLLMSGLLVCLVGLLHGERLTLERFNRQDVALALVALALIAGLFVDPATVQEFIQQAQAAAQEDTGSAGAAATGAD